MRSIISNFGLYVNLALAEIRPALVSPGRAWRALVICMWALTAIVLGTFIGLMAVMLPPMSVFSFVLLFGVILLWAAPDLPKAPDTLIRRMLIVALIVNLVIPVYYTVQIASLPWISARRLVTFPLIVVFAIAFSTSMQVRQRIAKIIKSNRLIAICVFGFPFAAFLSIFTSIAPLASASGLMDLIIEVYAFFMIILYVIRDDTDVDFLVRLIMWSALFVSMIGPIDVMIYRSVYVAMLPDFIVRSLASNPGFSALITGSFTRAGQFRAASVFNIALSFAEFEAMMTPLAAVFVLNGQTWRDRLFGCVLMLFCLIGIFVSGSRGGYVSAFIGLTVFVLIWIVRSYCLEFRSMKPAAAGSLAAGLIIILIGGTLFVPALHNRIIGGGEEQASNEGRRIQWEMATPKILSNPLTGHGYDASGGIIGYRPCAVCMESVDSYLLSALVETGILGVVTFFGAILTASFFGLRRYVFDQTWPASLAGALACSLIAYFVYKLVLSQKENVSLADIFICCIMFLNFSFARDKLGKSA